MAERRGAARCGTIRDKNNSGVDINKAKDTPITPAVTEPTLCVAGGRYTESWLRDNPGQLFGILSEIAVEFLAAVDAARADAAESGAPPELPRAVSASYTHRHAPVIPVHYEAPPPWRIAAVEPPEVVSEEEIAEE